MYSFGFYLIDDSCDVILIAFGILFLVKVVLRLGLWLLLQVKLWVGFGPYKMSGAQSIVIYIHQGQRDVFVLS